MTNLLQAIQCVVKNSISDLRDSEQGKNRIHQKGIPLEDLVKDIFADSLEECDKSIRVSKHSQVFSYLGNQNNPPDLMIKQGDAIEVKKIASFRTGIQLNSSYPKSKLFANDPMITAECRKAKGEMWESKDLIYAIGVVKDKKLKRLWLIVGDCLAADSDIYLQTKDKISAGLGEICGIEFSETRELGRVNRVDPLGITYLRIRGMWGISNPVDIYNYININYNEAANLEVIAIMTAEKYNSFPPSDIVKIEKSSTDINSLEIKDIQIKSPNNPASLIKAKLITYQN
jgi:NgoPII restriction endonuclease